MYFQSNIFKNRVFFPITFVCAELDAVKISWEPAMSYLFFLSRGKQRSRFHVGRLIEINDHREQGQCCNKQNVIYLAAVSDLISLEPSGSLSLSLPCWNKKPLTSLDNQLKPFSLFPVLAMLLRVGKQGPTFIQKQFCK